MKRNFWTLAFAVAAATLAFNLHRSDAQVTVPGQPMVALGYCQLTSLGSSTALASCSGGIPTGTNAIAVRAEAQALRYRPDGATTAPTAGVGMPLLVADIPLFLQGGSVSLTNLRFIEQVSGGKLNVVFYRAPQ